MDTKVVRSASIELAKLAHSLLFVVEASAPCTKKDQILHYEFLLMFYKLAQQSADLLMQIWKDSG